MKLGRLFTRKLFGRPEPEPEPVPDFIVSEGIAGTFYYHISRGETHSKALCGAETMSTRIPLSTWGYRGHLNERYCMECAEIHSVVVKS